MTAVAVKDNTLLTVLGYLRPSEELGLTDLARGLRNLLALSPRSFGGCEFGDELNSFRSCFC